MVKESNEHKYSEILKKVCLRIRPHAIMKYRHCKELSSKKNWVYFIPQHSYKDLLGLPEKLGKGSSSTIK